MPIFSNDANEPVAGRFFAVPHKGTGSDVTQWIQRHFCHGERPCSHAASDEDEGHLHGAAAALLDARLAASMAMMTSALRQVHASEPGQAAWASPSSSSAPFSAASSAFFASPLEITPAASGSDSGSVGLASRETSTELTAAAAAAPEQRPNAGSGSGQPSSSTASPDPLPAASGDSSAGAESSERTLESALRSLREFLAAILPESFRSTIAAVEPEKPAQQAPPSPATPPAAAAAATATHAHAHGAVRKGMLWFFFSSPPGCRKSSS